MARFFTLPQDHARLLVFLHVGGLHNFLGFSFMDWFTQSPWFFIYGLVDSGARVFLMLNGSRECLGFSLTKWLAQLSWFFTYKVASAIVLVFHIQNGSYNYPGFPHGN